MACPVGAGSGLAQRPVEKGFGEPGSGRPVPRGRGRAAAWSGGALEQQGSESAPLRRSGRWPRAAS